MEKSHYHRQGSLDGLCGHYAIVNALTVCGALKGWRKQQAMLLEIWDRHKELYEGMYFYEMRRVIHYLQRSRKWPAGVAAHALSENGTVQRNRDEYLKQIFSERNVQCAVIQVQRCEDDWEDHWLVIKRSIGRLQFIDSVDQNGRKIIRKDRTSLKMGRQKNKHSRSSMWRLIKPREAILFKSVKED
ncbi:hypothetical protein [Afipia sp. DC4300-2b1]|uniref:hypothetical protein n=1 Tax=Afipia sp. DC4300-2b1 TaxID=2804672 RepID=UPI003CEA5C84